MISIIEAQTTSAVSETVKLENEASYSSPRGYYTSTVPCTLCVDGTLGSTEEITIEFFVNGNWQTLKSNDATTTLTESNNVVSLYAPLTIRINKPVTANSVGVCASVKISKAPNVIRS